MKLNKQRTIVPISKNNSGKRSRLPSTGTRGGEWMKSTSKYHD